MGATGGGGAGASGGLGGAGGAGGAGGSHEGDIYVDSSTGSDDAAGTLAAPVKTIKRALELFEAGRRVVLMAGSYSAASGEEWGYVLPAGAVVHGNTEGVELIGTPDETAFEAAGATLEFVSLEGFLVAVHAQEGVNELRHVTFTDNATALWLEGTAEANLTSFCAFQGEGTGASLSDTASLTMITGTLVDVSCQSFIFADASSSAALTDIDAHFLAGGLVNIGGTASFTLTDSMVEFEDGNYFISSGGDAHVVLAGSTLYNDDTNSTTISVRSASVLDITDSTLVGTVGSSSDGISLDDTPAVSLTNVMIADLEYGVRASGGSLTVSDSTFQSNYWHILIHDNTDATVRASIFSGGNYAVYHEGTVSPKLGSVATPGGNDFSGAAKCLYVSSGVTGSMTAVGNTWKPNLQGADAAGHFDSEDTFFGPAAGANVTIPTNFIVGM
jgi:hypothetical protein